MDLQQLFYIIGIIFMVMVIGILVAIALIIFYIRRKIFQITKIAARPAETAAEISAGIVEGVGLKVKEMLKTRKKASR